MRSTGHARSYKAWCFAVIGCFSTALIGTFRSLLFTQWFAPSAVGCRTALLLLCFLIVGIYASGISIPLSLLMFIWVLYEMHVVYKEMLFTRKWQNGIWLVEYNSSTWKKLPYLHVVQWLGIFKLDFGRCFHSTWWNVSCLACVLWEKEREKHILN